MSRLESFRPSVEVMAALETLSENLARERKTEVDRRSRQRKPMQVPCRISFVSDGVSKTTAMLAQTRNISSKGLGLVAKRCFHQDEPIEVMIQPAGRPPMFMAGLVKFCRYIANGFFEVGIELRIAAEESVFGEDPVRAQQKHEWLAEAMQRKNDNVFFNETRRQHKAYDRLMR